MLSSSSSDRMVSMWLRQRMAGEMNHNVRCAADQRRWNGQQQQHSINKLNSNIIGTIVIAILSSVSLTKTKSAPSNRNRSAFVYYPAFLSFAFLLFCVGCTAVGLCYALFLFSYSVFIIQYFFVLNRINRINRIFVVVFLL